MTYQEGHLSECKEAENAFGNTEGRFIYKWMQRFPETDPLKIRKAAKDIPRKVRGWALDSIQREGQRALATKTGITQVGRLKHGIVYPDILTLQRIARHIGISVTEFVLGDCDDE